MKRLMKVLALVAVLAAVLAVSAFAADFEHCADALKDLGLFQGTTKGYELDRAPNRAEAGVMLVRLLGQEEAAKALEYTAPFTDVQDWAKPYVQYLYDNGLTNGKTATAFGYADKCTAQQYATFLLRALGYSDAENGDFTYADALKFAAEKGVVDAVNCDASNFLRDDVVAMSYTALATAPKSGEADLLTKLVKDGAVKDAKGYDKKFELYREYAAAAVGAKNEAKSHMALDITLAAKMAGLNYMAGTMQMDMVMDMNVEQMDQSKMAVTTVANLKIDDAFAKVNNFTDDKKVITDTLNYYYTDGYFYMLIQNQKTKIPLSFESALAQAQAANLPTNEPISLLKDITVSNLGGVNHFTIDYAPGAYAEIMNLAASMAGSQTGATAKVDVSNFSMSSVIKNGKIDSSAINMSMRMNITAAGQTVTMDLDMSVKSTTVATGSAVTVTLPADLNTYVEAPAA